MKKSILLLVLVALMPVCNLLYAQVQIQGTYQGVSYTGDTGKRPLLTENYISLKECESLVAIDLSFPNVTSCSWTAFTPNFDIGLQWYGPYNRDPYTHHFFGPVSCGPYMNFTPKLEHQWITFDIEMKTKDGRALRTYCKFIIRP